MKYHVLSGYINLGLTLPLLPIWGDEQSFPSYFWVELVRQSEDLERIGGIECGIIVVPTNMVVAARRLANSIHEFE